MVRVICRTWRSGPRRVKRLAWGLDIREPSGKRTRLYNSAWTEADAEQARAAHLLGQAAPAPPPAPSGR